MSKECDIDHYWYFLSYSFKSQPNVCSRCHDLLMVSMKPSNIAIWNIKGSGYDGIRQNQVSFLAYREDSKKIGLFDQQNKNNIIWFLGSVFFKRYIA